MRFAFLSFLPLFLLFFIQSAFADEGISGYWLTENERAVIHITPCEDSLCGSVYWIIEGGLQIDQFNPDESLRDRPVCGLRIMGDFEQEEPGDWEDGYIYKADDGDRYDADIELLEDGRLEVRGYLGISLFGKTQHWTRVSKNAYKSCRS